jgi:hypothetical protein
MQIKILDDKGNVFKTLPIDMERRRFFEMLKRVRPGSDELYFQTGKGTQIYKLSYNRKDASKGKDQSGGFLPLILAALPAIGKALALGAVGGVGSAAAGGIIGAIKRAIERGKQRRAERRALKEAEEAQATEATEPPAEQGGSGMAPVYSTVLKHKGLRPNNNLWRIVDQVHRSDLSEDIKTAITKMINEYLSNLKAGPIPAVVYEQQMSGRGLGEAVGEVFKSIAGEMTKEGSSSFFSNMAKEIAKSTASGLLKDAVIGLAKKFFGNKKSVSREDVIRASREVSRLRPEEVEEYAYARPRPRPKPGVKPLFRAEEPVIRRPRPTYDDEDDFEDPPEYEEPEPPKPAKKAEPAKPEPPKKKEPSVNTYQYGFGSKKPLTSYQRFTSKIFDIHRGTDFPAQKVMSLSSKLWKELKAKGTIQYNGIQMSLSQF